MDARRRVASVSALGGAIGAVAIDALYVNDIASQGVTPAGGRVLLVAAWIAVSALVAIIGAFTGAPSRRAWLLAWLGGPLIGIANGTLREVAYSDRVGELTAHQISTGSAIALFAGYFELLAHSGRWPRRVRRWRAVSPGSR